MTPDAITLTVNGRVYQGWTAVRVSRGIDRCVGDFDIEVTERWTGQDMPWRILPFTPCTVQAGSDLLLTGYVDDYAPSFGPTAHAVRVTGRSLTEDLVDCTPDIKAGQFNGYTLQAIANAVCAIFGITVVAQAEGAQIPFATVQIERCETAFSFLERLGRMCGVLLTDNAAGNLVLATAGATLAAGRLVQGENFKAATGKLSSRKHFSDYVVKGQSGLAMSGGGGGGWAGAGGSAAIVTESLGVTTVAPTQSAAGVPTGAVQTQLRAAAHDAGVPRYRPRVVMAESQLTLQQMQLRANWMMAYAAGKATEATITVAGWRQPDNSLWTANQVVPVTSDYLGIDQDLLIVKVEFSLDEHGGHQTHLTVGPVAGYTPDPGQVKVRKGKHGKGGRGGSGVNWDGAGT